MPPLVLGSIVSGLGNVLGSLFSSGKSDQLKGLEFQANRQDKQRPYSFSLLDPNKNPELKARLGRGQNQFDFRQMAQFMNPRQVALLNTMSPFYGVAGNMTGGGQNG